MKISYEWLQLYFNKKLPKPEKVAELLTTHSLEVESVEKKGKDYVFDISVTPNRTHDCLSHIGIAREVAVLLNSKLKTQNSKLQVKSQNLKNKLNIEVKEPELCRRYVGRLIEGVKVKDSPKWPKERLVSIGQKTINNIVDAANFVMFEMGQPLHAFDADKVEGKIIVRKAKKGEKITSLDNQKMELDESVLVIADEKSLLAIAGVKGGKKAEITEKTKNIILEAANFEPIGIRKTSQKINLATESSLRFGNEISPELAGKAMERLTEIILKTAGGKAGPVVDFYPRHANHFMLGIHPHDVSGLLGIKIEEKEIISILQKLGFEIKKINPLKKLITIAKSLVGRPYKYGASVSYDAPKYFDCSSFASYVFLMSGSQIPRMTIDQYFYGKMVEMKDIKQGDVVFANTKCGKIHYESKEFMAGQKIKEGVDHCGIYLGKGKVIHATRTKGKVVIEDFKKSKSFKNLCGIRRFIEKGDDLLLLAVPPERLDIRIKEDVIEEIARIYGYERIPAKLPEEALILPERNDFYFYADAVRNILSGAGFSEVYNYSFSKDGKIEIINPIASDKKCLRANLLNGLRRNIEDNLRNFKQVKFFEIGKIFPPSGEIASLAFVISQADFYEIKGIAESLLEKVGIDDYYFQDHPDKTAEVRAGNVLLGHIDRNGCEIDFETLVKLATEETEYRPVSRYPAVKRDLSIYVPVKTKVIEVLDVIENIGGELLIDTDLFDIYEEEINGGNEEGRKSFAFHLIFQSPKGTLSDNEVNRLMDKIMSTLDANPLWEVRRA